MAEFKGALRENIVKSLDDQVKERQSIKSGRDLALLSSSPGQNSVVRPEPGHASSNNNIKQNGRVQEEFSDKAAKAQVRTPGDWKEFTHLGKREIIRPVYFNVNKSTSDLKEHASGGHEISGSPGQIGGAQPASQKSGGLEKTDRATPKRPPSEYEKEEMNVSTSKPNYSLIVYSFAISS